MRPNDVIGFLGIAAMLLIGTTVVFAVLWLRTREQLIRAQLAGGSPLDASTERLERIERGVDSVAMEVERLAEMERFAAQIIARSAVDPTGLPGTRSTTPH